MVWGLGHHGLARNFQIPFNEALMVLNRGHLAQNRG